MKVRRFKTDIEQLKEAGLSFVRQSGETKMIYRATIVNMYLNGTSTKSLSDLSLSKLFKKKSRLTRYICGLRLVFLLKKVSNND